MRLPGLVRGFCIRRLARLTAGSLGVRPPRIPGNAAAALEGYAAFTAAEAIRWSASADARETERRLFAAARNLGRHLRAFLVIRSPARACRVMRSLYGIIGVHFCGEGDRFVVSSCYFASRYTPVVCRAMSSLDAGLYAGLSGGGELAFQERITEGAIACAGGLR